MPKAVPASTHLVRLRAELSRLDVQLASLLVEPGFDNQRLAYTLETKRNMVAKQIKRLGGR